ncbi:uncharacterized protein LOC132736438 isoform X2 [Ruditapes philippinarum]|jgi:hypothetical protein|nr:uncharacterized protein LOC132736438 isoform X2 [Ruditapes philippinarum]
MTWNFQWFCCDKANEAALDDIAVVVSSNHVEEMYVTVRPELLQQRDGVTLNQCVEAVIDEAHGRLSKDERNEQQYLDYHKEKSTVNDQNQHLDVYEPNGNLRRYEENVHYNKGENICINKDAVHRHDKPWQADDLLDSFLSCLLVEIKSKLSKSELYDIRNAVENLVSYLLNKLEQIEPVLRVGEIIPTGSCYDGTKILQPDEFDFLAVIDCLSLNNLTTAVKASKELCSADGYAHALCDERSPDGSRFIEQDDDNCVVACRRSNSLRELFRDRFHMLLLNEINNTYSLVNHTGVLNLEGFSISINGPQCNVKVVWKPKDDPNSLPVDIDITPAIKCSLKNVLVTSDVINDDVFKLMSKHQYLYLIPRPQRSCNKCFKMVFPHSDQHLVTTLSESHRKVLLILKYLACEMLKFDFRLKTIFNSFTMKTALLHHSLNCKESDGQSVSICLNTTLDYMKHQLDRRVPEMTSVFTVRRNVWKNAENYEITLARVLIRDVAVVFNKINCGKFKDSNFAILKRELLFACSNSVPLSIVSNN